MTTAENTVYSDFIQYIELEIAKYGCGLLGSWFEIRVRV